jgi:hypothetical protein
MMPEEQRQKTRDAFRIVIDGDNVPPPIPTFQVTLGSQSMWNDLAKADTVYRQDE